jgi:predicted HD superfamily hydrolase involved in NAD metabolism
MYLHPILKGLVSNLEFTGDIKQDVYSFLIRNQCPKTAEHSILVGETASEIAERFGHDNESAMTAGYLHDISAVFQCDTRIEVSKELGIDVLHEEIIFPMIVHQNISKIMAKQIFAIEDESILEAVGCHTTLKSNSSELDRVLFVADKISWDQCGVPPYLDELNKNLMISLEHGAFSYIRYLWKRKESLRVVHPWLREAYYEMKEKLEN